MEPILLLVRRHNTLAENGRFVIPGDFVPNGKPRTAAGVRDLAEETGLRNSPDTLLAVGVIKGNGRDPQDTAERWVCSHLIIAHLRDNDPASSRTLAAGGDASRALFVSLSRRPSGLIFDHYQLLAMVLRPA